MRIINGIQQVGIGVTDADKAFDWYRAAFGTDVVIFRDHAAASLMKRYTGGVEQDRYAILSMNLNGGAGLEIWQYESRDPVYPERSFNLSALGIFAVKIKCKAIEEVFTFCRDNQFELASGIEDSPSGIRHFFLKDPFGNLFDVEESSDWFSEPQKGTGAVSGVCVGVSDMERSYEFYKLVAGYDEVVYDRIGQFPDLFSLPAGKGEFRRVLLKRSDTEGGGFCRLLGEGTIELLQSCGSKGEHLYKNRYWGDPGFIHLCLDITDFCDHGQQCANAGYPLTVDSRSGFDMGEASGHFGYNEDPDGTLIEFVETHRVPIMKKWGWYLNMQKRNPRKPLPDWMVRCLAFNREKQKS